MFALVLALLMIPMPPGALASSDLEADFVAAINQERADRGLPQLSVSSELTSVARSHAARMADDASLHHNPNLGSEVSGWQKVGENVGRGPSVSAIHAALMSSTNHRDNILGTDWTEVGVGVEVRDGTVWVTQVFRLPQGASASSADDTPPSSEPDEQDPAPDEQQQGDSGSDSPGPTEPSASSTNGKEETPDAEEPRHDVTDRSRGWDRTLTTLMRLQKSPHTNFDLHDHEDTREHLGQILWPGADPHAQVRSGRLDASSR